MRVKLKGKVYRTAVRSAMAHGAESQKKASEKRMEVAEMRMLRWMCAVMRRDTINNAKIKGTIKVVEVFRKVQEARLTWYGYERWRK